MDSDPDFDPRFRDAAQFDSFPQLHDPADHQQRFQFYPDSHDAFLSARQHLHDPTPSRVDDTAAGVDANASTDPDARHAFASVSPDDFYTSFQAATYLGSHPDVLPMASSAARKPLRSPGDDTAPRRPVTSSTRNPNTRSASSPVDGRPVARTARGYGPGAPGTVSDLKKRFDQQNGGSAPTSIPRAAPRPGTAARTGVKRDPVSSKPQSSSVSYSALRTGALSTSPTNGINGATSPHSNRAKFVSEDQVSSNPQSFASRVSKPRTSVSGNPIASKSLTHLPHKSKTPVPPLPTSPPTATSSRGLLFGEIPPQQLHTAAAGYGIDALSGRRTSEPHLQDAVHRQRSFSDPDVEPVSPTGWYRGVHASEEGNPDQSGQASTGHARSQSDAATPLPTQTGLRQPDLLTPASLTSNLPSSTSKLPLSINRIHSPTHSPSPSPRSTSPATLKRPPPNGKTSAARNPNTRAKTPISRDRTPTQSMVGRKPPPPTLASVNSSARLQAYISSPPPKTSPPLRSSRPRQPVSVASTASSRMKMADRALSPAGQDRLASGKWSDAPQRRRKISIGPIDFEQRREHIRLAYSKSIRESQALEARQRATERRRKEVEAAARAKTAAAEVAANATTMSRSNSTEELSPLGSRTQRGDILPEDDDEDPSELQPELDDPVEEATPIAGPAVLLTAPLEPAAEPVSPQAPPVLTLFTTAHAEDWSTDQHDAEGAIQSLDSPSLGVPGSFPALSPPLENDEVPNSAISATSVVTEFDAEPQTDLPDETQSPLGIAIQVQPSSPQRELASRPRSEYQYPFEDEPDSPARPQLRLNPSRDLLPSATITDFADQLVIPGAFVNDYTDDYDDVSPTDPKYSSPLGITAPSQNDFTNRDEIGQAVPFPRLDSHDESECQSEADESQVDTHDAHLDHGEVTDTCSAEETDDPDNIPSQVNDSQYEDQPYSQRTSTCASTDADELDEPPYSYVDQTTADTSNSLHVPASNGDRSSNQSSWTDYTVTSAGVSDAGMSPEMEDDESPTFGHVTIFQSGPATRDSVSSLARTTYSTSEVRPSMDSSRSSAYLSQHNQLPHIDAGEDFSVAYVHMGPGVNLNYVASPEYEPPPVPNSASGSAFDSRRASSAFYEQSQYDSTLLNSERGSEDYTSQVETPLSMNTASLGTPEHDLASGATTLVDHRESTTSLDKDEKKQQRLIQRRNVIKELVDTEAVFVRDMNIIEEIYKGTAEACPELDSTTIKLVFRNTDEIIKLHTSLLNEIKEAVAAVYVPKSSRSRASRDTSILGPGSEQPPPTEISDANDYQTRIGPVFATNMEKLKLAHESFLRNSDHAAKKLILIQQDPTVKLWLNECNEVAKDLTAAWDLDSLLIKPMQRITKYPNLMITLLQYTPQDHPDRQDLLSAKDLLETAILEINKTKKNFELVGQIVGRKRKESDVKASFTRAFGKRVDKLQASSNRPAEDPGYAKLNEKFGDDYLRLQVVLRDVEFYTRQVSAYVHEFLQYLSSIELVMRLQPGSYPELESKWVQFNISTRDLEKVVLEEHLLQVRKHVIEPFELVIKAYGNPSLAMKKRQKRRGDYERYEQLRRAGKSTDSKLNELVEQYEALNDTLKKELPKLSELTEKIGNICLGNLVNIQANWYKIWKDKMKLVLGDCPDMPSMKEVVATFHRDFPFASDQLANLAILNPAYKGRASQSTTASTDDVRPRTRPRPADVDTRGRAFTANGEVAPSLPTPDFIKRSSGSFAAVSPPVIGSAAPSPHHYYYKDYYAGIQATPGSSAMQFSPELPTSARSVPGTGPGSTRPSTGRSFESGVLARQSSDSAVLQRPDTNTTYNSTYPSQEGRRFSGLFHSALPLPDGPDEGQRSRASSRERNQNTDGYNVLWLAASLFEFNINTTKHEAGYPYLVYQAGEIFDVIAEKGELWLAKNQDDPKDQVGWIWSKHFAKLADS